MIQQASKSHSQLLLDEFRQGSEDAASEIFNLYHLRLLNVAKSRISTSLQSRFDADDVVQSAFIEFFQKTKESETRITTFNELWSLLARFTVNKTLSYIEKELARKRSPYRESHGLSQILPNQREISPVEESIFREELQLLFENMNSRDRRIIELHLRGANTNDIVHQFAVGRTVSDTQVQSDVSPATVRRVLRESSEWLREQLTGE